MEISSIKEEQLDFALDTMNRLKESTKNNAYFNPKFTKIDINAHQRCQITRNWYEVYRTRAIEISKQHHIFPEKFNKNYGPAIGESITDDDTIADWLDQYDGNLGKIQKDYPKLTLNEIVELFTWYTMCQQRANAPYANEFINIITY